MALKPLCNLKRSWAEADTPTIPHSTLNSLFIPTQTMGKSELVIRQVATNVWTFSRPFQRAPFIPFGGRSTAIRLEDGSVWLLASTKADEETLNKLRQIGPVKWIVAPDVVHWLNLKDFAAAFPTAKVIGVEGLELKVTGLKFDGLYGKDPEGTQYGFESEIIAQYFSGFENKDVAFFHGPSKTLVEADLLFNFPPKEQYSQSTESGTTWVPLVGSLSPYKGIHKKFLKALGKGVDAMRFDAAVVASWDFDRIIPCHGDVVETNGNAAWREAYKGFLN